VSKLPACTCDIAASVDNVSVLWCYPCGKLAPPANGTQVSTGEHSCWSLSTQTHRLQAGREHVVEGADLTTHKTQPRQLWWQDAAVQVQPILLQPQASLQGTQPTSNSTGVEGRKERGSEGIKLPGFGVRQAYDCRGVLGHLLCAATHCLRTEISRFGRPMT
jgi:hypothetical protein